MKRIFGLIAALIFAGSASAYVITPTGDVSGGEPGGLDRYQVEFDLSTDSVGDSFSLLWEHADPTVGDNVSAFGTFKIEEFTSSSLVLQVALSNTSAQGVVTSFGLNVDPLNTLTLWNQTNSDGILFSDLGLADDNKLTSVNIFENFPGFQTIDLCIFNQNCSGGSVNTGLQEGDVERFTMGLYSDTTGGITLSDFAMKFQAIESYQLPGNPCHPQTGQDCEPPVKVALPATALLLGLGVLGFAGIRHKLDAYSIRT